MTQEAFGELRSALQENPSPRQFERCIDVLLCYHQVIDHATLQNVWMPYIQHHLLQGWQEGDRSLSGELAMDFLLKLPECASLLQSLDLSNLELNGRQLTQLLQNQWLSSLTHLSLANNSLGPVAIKSLGAATHLSRLQSLNLSENPIGSRGLAEFVLALDLRALHTLDLTCTNSGPSGVTQLARASLPKLRTLYIGHNKLSDAGLLAMTRAPWAPLLEKLSLSSNTISPRGTEEIFAQHVIPSIRTLSISHNQLEQPGLVALSRADHLHQLDTLHLAGCFRVNTPCDFDVLHDASHLLTLETLNLDANSLSSQAALSILSNPNLTNLRALSLARNRFHNFPRFQRTHLHNLRALNLSSCHLDDSALRTLTQPGLAKLESLNLADNHFDSSSLLRLAEATHMNELKYLSLENNQAIDDEGFLALLEAPHLSRLKRLNVNDTSITDAAARALLDAPLLDRLEFISLRHCNNLSDDLRKKLRFAARSRPLTLFV